MNVTREIPRTEWKAFLEGFTRRNVERPATVQVLGRALGAQYEVRRLTLQGIFLERSRPTITIVLGDAPTLVEHPVGSPVRVWVESSDDGRERSLEIEGADETKTIVELARR
jgi:hypothetical protein